MNIEQGLFQFDLTDYHAILGVSLDADAKVIRKRYLQIARKLHPDSLRGGNDDERRKANELLSKMVNPAYEVLNQEKSKTEHLVVLRLRGQRLSRQPTVNLQAEAAKEIAKSNNPTSVYNNSLKALAERQYEAIDHVLEITGQLSELNLAYLMSTADSSSSGAIASKESSGTASSPAAKASSPAASRSQAPPPPPSPRQQREAIIESSFNRAAEFALKKRLFPRHFRNARCG